MTDELTDLGHHEPGVVANLLELGVHRRRRGAVQAPVELEPHREGELPQRIVQLVGDPDPLAHANGFGGLRVQASALEGHGGEVRRGPEYFDLFSLEYPRRPVADREDSDRHVVVEERYRQHRPDRNLATRRTRGARPSRTGEEIGSRYQAPIAERLRLDRAELQPGHVIVE